MKVVKVGSELRPETAPIFDGQVFTQPLVTEQDAAVTRLTLVRFSRGARTKWHIHTFDQVLLVTEGRGVVADEKEEHHLEVGDLIIVPAGTVHWHGATGESDFAHINIALAGETKIVRPHTPDE